MSVDAGASRHAAAALAALADLTPAAARRTESWSVPTDWFRWLDTGLDLLGGPVMHDPGDSLPSPGMTLLREVVSPQPTPTHQTVRLERELGERLAAVQQVRAGRHAVRIGWLWVAGTASVTTTDGSSATRQVFQPLVTRTVRVVGGGRSWQLAAYGDVEISPLVGDREAARALEERIETGGGALDRLDRIDPVLLGRLTRLQAFAFEAARAAGFAPAQVTIDRRPPDALRRDPTLSVVVGLGVYTTDEASRTGRSGALRSWDLGAVGEPTAFHAVYGGAGVETHAAGADEPTPRVESPLPLSSGQLAAVRRARTDALTVISGAPGTGKSHTLVAIVCDALAAGRSVLVAAKDDAAVDALTALLGRQPGLMPVVFGSSELRERLAQRLSNGELVPADRRALHDARIALDRAIEVRDEARAAARRTLHHAWRRTDAGRAERQRTAALFPGLGDIDGAELETMMSAATVRPTGPIARWRRTRAERRLRRRLGADELVPLAALVAACEVARDAAEEPDTPDTAGACRALEHADGQVRRCLTAWLALETRSPDRLDRAGLSAVATLATALRSGRNARRAQLARLQDRTLARALPLWMGTLADVDDLLPPVAGLFDLVLIDEASATEQTLAAPTLLRGRRAVVVGDPRQLRHVSFVSDATIDEILGRHDVPREVRAQLDVRRNSLYDAAAAVSPVHLLDEHFRSAPHLIDVVARSLYDGRLHVATRSPATHDLDCVHLRTTTGARDPSGVVRAEVDEVITCLRALGSGPGHVGVVTPFRAQADAIEAAVLAAFTADDLVRLGVRIGTVHSFQGNERQTVYCSLALADGDPGGWRFVNDPHLLAVMLTRARTTMTVVTSCSPPADSLLGTYLASADAPPGAPAPAGIGSAWARWLADELRRSSVQLWERYPTGHHVVDIASAWAGRPVAVVCDLHADGIDAHLDRHLALVRAGWHVVDALEPAWDDDRARLVVELAHRLADDLTDADG